MSKLVVYYSSANENHLDGTDNRNSKETIERVSELVANIAKAERFKIEQKIPYASDDTTCAEHAKKDKASNARPELVSLPNDMEKYDEIFIGYPICFETMPTAVYTFLESCNLAGKTIHPFCTHEGSGIRSTVEEIRSIVSDATVTDGLAVREGCFESERFRIIRWEPIYKNSPQAYRDQQHKKEIETSHQYGGVGGHSTHALYHMTDFEIAQDWAKLQSEAFQKSAKEGQKIILKVVCFIFIVVLGIVFLGVFALIPILLYAIIMFVIPVVKKKKKSKDGTSDAQKNI